MSLSLLLEKYDVSTEEGLQKALNEIEKEERDVDEALSTALSKTSILEGRLQTVSQAYTKLGDVKVDAQIASDMVEKTASLAQDVSAKVRQLDLARSRVAECQRRVHDLIDLQLCSAGVEAALKAHDYETGAAHVARFLSMDPGSVAAARARGEADPRSAMAAAADTLRGHLVTKFEEAARKEDEAAIERLFRLFPQIGRGDDGVQLLANYLAHQVESKLRHQCKVTDAGSDRAFAVAFSRAVEVSAAAVRRVLLAKQPGAVTRALARLQPAVCAGCRRLYGEMASVRGLGSILANKKATPLSVEPVLAELAVTHSTLRLYFQFISQCVETDTLMLSEPERNKSKEAAEKIINECDLMRTAQDILGHYLTLERFFLEESVSKALKMSTPQPGATTSSLVDDVYFIARKVIRRSISTGSVDGACAVINDAASALEREVATALRRYLRSPPHQPLPFTGPRDEYETSIFSTKDGDNQAALFLAHTSEAEAGALWAERLAEEAAAAAAALCRRAADTDKLHSCAAGLAGAAAAFRAALDLAISGIKASLKPKVNAWAEALTYTDPDTEDTEEDADALPSALDAFLQTARSELSGTVADTLMLALITDITAAAEANILKRHYDRAGGIAVERRARRLAAWAGGAGLVGGRERAARLAAAAALLALEHVDHAHHVASAPRLTLQTAKMILARRTDFKMEDIKRLKF